MNRFYVCVLLAFGAVGCTGYDPVAECQRGCDMCAPAGTDCDVECATADTDYDQARAEATTAGCLVEFDGLLDCVTTGDICETTPRCDTPIGAYVDCYIEFCTANPESPACM